MRPFSNILKKGMYAELKNKVGTNALRRHYKAGKRHGGGAGGGLQDCKIGVFAILYTVWYKCIYISEKYMGLPESNKVSRKGM